MAKAKKKSETIYCATLCCEAVATHITSTGMPLCTTCASCYELGQASPDDPLTEIEQEE